MQKKSDIKELQRVLSRCIQVQMEHVARWHEEIPPEMSERDDLESLVLREHWINFQLWHVEDEARRTDVGPEVIAECKRQIDRLNQKRNDQIEVVDKHLVAALTPMLPKDAQDVSNTETVGMALDRLSILSLKIYHMREQADRPDADQGLKDECSRKLSVLLEQHADLHEAVLALVGEYLRGEKRPKLYCQFKMYNDPRLNPQLYGRSGRNTTVPEEK